MSFLPITNKAGVLVGIYLVNAIVPPLGIYYSVSGLPGEEEQGLAFVFLMCFVMPWCPLMFLVSLMFIMLCQLLTCVVDRCKRRRCNQTGFRFCHCQRLFQYRQHYRPSDIPQQGRSRVQARQDYCAGHTGCVSLYDVSPVLVLRLAQSDAKKPKRKRV